MRGTIALFQGEETVGEVEKTLSKMKEKIRHASLLGAQLIVFPELYVTGYHMSHDEARRLAQPRSGSYFSELSAAAKEAGVAVLYGYPEREESSSGQPRYYNSAQLIDRDGKALVNYRKLHLWLTETERDEAVYTPGESLAEVVECCGWKVGILICYDLDFPEVSRILSLQGADLILCPTALIKNFSKTPKLTVPARAMDNEAHVAYVNYGGGEFLGRSVCCSPDGEVVVSTGSEEVLLLAPINPDNKLDHSAKKDRRPEVYKALSDL